MTDMPHATAGDRVLDHHYQVLAAYDQEHAITTVPNSNIPGMFSAAQINQAIDWWNTLPMLQQQLTTLIDHPEEPTP